MSNFSSSIHVAVPISSVAVVRSLVSQIVPAYFSLSVRRIAARPSLSGEWISLYARRWCTPDDSDRRGLQATAAHVGKELPSHVLVVDVADVYGFKSTLWGPSGIEGCIHGSREAERKPTFSALSVWPNYVMGGVERCEASWESPTFLNAFAQAVGLPANAFAQFGFFDELPVFPKDIVVWDMSAEPAAH